jgi:hypothetical protein
MALAGFDPEEKMCIGDKRYAAGRSLAESLTKGGIGRAYDQSSGIGSGLENVPKRQPEIPQSLHELEQAVNDLGAVIDNFAKKLQPVMNVAAVMRAGEEAEKNDAQCESPAQATEVSRRIAASSSRLYCLNRTIRALTEALEV